MRVLRKVMKEFWDKVKDFFKDKLNTAIVSLIAIFLIMVILPIENEVFSKIAMFTLAIAMLIVGYKCIKKHKQMQDVYDNIDSNRQEKKFNTFEKISDKFEKSNRYNYLIYAIVCGIFACMIIIGIVFK